MSVPFWPSKKRYGFQTVRVTLFWPPYRLSRSNGTPVPCFWTLGTARPFRYAVFDGTVPPFFSRIPYLFGTVPYRNLQRTVFCLFINKVRTVLFRPVYCFGTPYRCSLPYCFGLFTVYVRRTVLVFGCFCRTVLVRCVPYLCHTFLVETYRFGTFRPFFFY